MSVAPRYSIVVIPFLSPIPNQSWTLYEICVIHKLGYLTNSLFCLIDNFFTRHGSPLANWKADMEARKKRDCIKKVMICVPYGRVGTVRLYPDQGKETWPLQLLHFPLFIPFGTFPLQFTLYHGMFYTTYAYPSPFSLFIYPYLIITLSLQLPFTLNLIYLTFTIHTFTLPMFFTRTLTWICGVKSHCDVVMVAWLQISSAKLIAFILRPRRLNQSNILGLPYWGSTRIKQNPHP